ncbi:MAG: caspase family protein, partial [Candidatus Tectomicrobia bacterium]|nr:caspase family protein [Candidatus Tectomicrobia bacterium]
DAQFLVQRDTAVVAAGETGGRKRLQTASAQDTTAPTITLTSPNLTRSARTLVSTSQATIVGQALDESGIVEVSVNGAMANLDGEGNFSKHILLRIGDNPVELTAMDLYANVAKLQFVIQRQADNMLSAERMIKRYKVGKYYAMIVGNNNYQHLPKLETAVKDATEVDKILKATYGFETELLLNATRSDMLSTLSRLRRNMLPEDNLLVYYAGHGVFEEVAQEAYWLPVDAKEDDVANWIIADSITSEMKRNPARHVLIVADSCYSGTLTRAADVNLSSRRGREYFLKKMFKQPSRTLMASGGNEPVVDNGSDGHSIFAYTFLRALKEIDEAVFTAEELFYKFVKQSVAGQAEQTPVYSIIRNSGHDGGDFVFIKR